MNQSNDKDASSAPVVIKKYANRRLYNTATSSYVTLDHLCDMVKEGIDFVVYDAKTGEDITRSVLTQIIFEEENKGRNLLPIGFLRQLIGFYDDGLRSVLPSYLEMSMQSFARNQEQMRRYVEDTFGDLTPVNQMQEWGRQNLALFQRTMNMFAPPSATGPSAEPPTGEPAASDQSEEIDRLKKQLADIQDQLNSMSGGSQK